MGIGVNDVKMFINGGFRYLIKTCHQWAKDHPFVSGVLLFFYLLYIFSPYLFSVLFYTFPFVICAAILLGKPRVKLEKCPPKDIKNIAKKEDISPPPSSPGVGATFAGSGDNGTSKDQHRRPYLTSQMSRRTIGKDKSKIISKTAEGISKQQENEGFPSSLLSGDDATIHKILEEEIMPMKMNKEKSSSNSFNLASEKTLSSTTSTSRSESDSEENKEPQEKSNNLVEWTEDDQRNLMDLGTSEIERNKRLESLIAKRRARKLLSMQPRRSTFEYLGSHLSFDDHIYQVGVIARAFDDGSGSTPSVRLHTQNPFDLPYDPYEEKPILTGGSFEEDLFPNVQKEARLCRHQSFRLGGTNSLGEHPLAKSLPSFFLKKPCFTQFRTESDVEENSEIQGLPREGNDPDPSPDRPELPREVQLSRTRSVRHDQPPTLLPREGNHQKFENESFVQNDDPTRLGSTSSTEGKKEKGLETKDNEEENIHIRSDATTVRDDDKLPQDISKNKEQDDGEDSSSSSSSSSSSTDIHVNATKNEAFRNSVKKVLTCLVLNPKSTGLQGKENLGASSSDPPQDSSPVAVLPTTMDERSIYTSQRHHSQTFSIASDMQVEVSETGSPTSGPPDPNSPTDRESLVYDGDVDKDANSGDEDLWAASPHPMRFGDVGTKFRLPDIIEESSNRASELGIAHDADDPPILSGAPEEVVQARGATALSLSPRSTLPGESRQEVVDQKSTNGDIIEPRSSSSSSSSSLSSSSRSKGLASQMQGKSEHLAEYLANLPPSETGSNTVEDPGPSHVRDTGAEVISILDESHAIFEMEEDKEDSKESKLSEESQENSEETTTSSQLEAPKEASSTFEEHVKDDLIKKHDSDQAIFVAEQNDLPRGLEDGPKATTEEDIHLREPLGHENEVIFGSLPSSEEDTIDKSKSTEQPSTKPEKDVTVVSGNQTQDEVVTGSPKSPIIQEESASPNPTTNTDQDVYDVDKLEADVVHEGGNENMQETNGEPKSTRLEEANTKLPTATGSVSSTQTTTTTPTTTTAPIMGPTIGRYGESSRQTYNAKMRRDRWSDRHDTPFD